MLEKNTKQIMPLNRVTFHVFKWLCHSGQIDVEALVKEAFDTTEECENYCIGDGGVHDAVYPQLAELIEERLNQLLEDWVRQVGNYFSAEECWVSSDVDYPPEGELDLAELFLPILCEKFIEVEAYGLAQAILRCTGHWKKQDRQRPRPELLPRTPEQDHRE